MCLTKAPGWIGFLLSMFPTPKPFAPCFLSLANRARAAERGTVLRDHRSSSVVLAAAAASVNVPKEVAIEPGALEHVTAARRSHRRGLAALLERREHAASSRQSAPSKLLLEHNHVLRDVSEGLDLDRRAAGGVRLDLALGYPHRPPTPCSASLRPSSPRSGEP